VEYRRTVHYTGIISVVMSFKKIDHINIVVRDLQAAKNFFVDLGFVVLKEGRLEGEWIDKIVNLPNVSADYIALALPNTQTNIELIKYYSPEGEKDSKLSLPNQIGFRHIAIEVEEIEKIVSDLKKRETQFFSNIQDYNNSKKLCYFLGPEGIIIELAEYE
jgi:catechol 2,3-dioxygenase-like lactoylglutathione lyase family enzyme